MDDELLQKIRKMADDEDWEVRETAASEIKKINDIHFEEYLPVWQEWVKDSNPNIRRAVEVGLLRIDDKYYEEAFELLIPLLYNHAEYVRKNCGPFALSAVAYRKPTESFKRFSKLINKEDHGDVLWNIAMCLGARFGKNYPQKSILMLKQLALDERRFVWRATASSLIKLLRRYPEYKDEVYSWEHVDHVLEVIKKYVEK